MSYLGPLRLHFSGRFQADPSTVNNDVRHYDNSTFLPRFQKPQDDEFLNGWWDPDGSGAFRLVGCRVTMVSFSDGSTSTRDPIVGMSIAGANARVAGKIVDLDPQQQLVSAIWGMIVRLTDDTQDYFSGPYVPAPFTDIWWHRAKGKGTSGDTGAGSFYQSVVAPVTWGDIERSRFLRELRAACGDDMLSIKFNVDGYNLDSTSARFTLGRLAGTIGPASANEPKHFVLGRQLLPQLTRPNHRPLGDMNFMQAVVDEKTRKIYADFGNALPTTRPGGPLKHIGPLELGYLDASNAFHSLGKVVYQRRDWYMTTAGIQSFPHNRTLTPAERRALSKSRLAVARDGIVIVKENIDGLYQRADNFVYRLEPGETTNFELWATQYGKPLPNATIIAYHDSSGLQPGIDTDAKIHGGAPEFGVPHKALTFPVKLTTGADGRATLPLLASDPGNPRGYIDGQVYGVRYFLPTIGKEFKQDPTFGSNPSDFVSILVFDTFEVPATVTWYDLEPIFRQYGNLYPIMDRIIDFRSYESVAKHAKLLAFAFGLPPEDPNSMPVTRDLSKGKRRAILKWLTTPGADGKPVLGMPPAIATIPTPKAFAETALQRAEHADAVGAKPSLGAKSFAIHTRLNVHIPEDLF